MKGNSDATARICALNDMLRRFGRGGRVMRAFHDGADAHGKFVVAIAASPPARAHRLALKAVDFVYPAAKRANYMLGPARDREVFAGRVCGDRVAQGGLPQG
jgi:hypothetical protein